MITRTNAILPISCPTPGGYQDKTGYFILPDGAICSAQTDIPLAALAEAGYNDASALICGAASQTVQVKIGTGTAPIERGTYLQLDATGAAIADTGSGARTLVARALETGTEGELIDAILLDPKPLT